MVENEISGMPITDNLKPKYLISLLFKNSRKSPNTLTLKNQRIKIDQLC
jgi:hypothetical protein